MNASRSATDTSGLSASSVSTCGCTSATRVPGASWMKPWMGCGMVKSFAAVTGSTTGLVSWDDS